jgi:hypothetical protein
MTRTTAILIAGAFFIAAGVFWIATGPGQDQIEVDLIDALPQATRSPSPAAFSVIQTSINGDSRRAVLVSEPSRLTFSIDVPDSAWLTFAFGLQEDAWAIEGDGVLFQVGVSDGAEFTELFSLVANPFANPSDRNWHDLIVDLSEYAGRRVDVIFNTRASPPDPPADDRRGDAALWAEPRIVSR